MLDRKTDFGDLRQFFGVTRGGGWGGKLTLTCPHDLSGMIKQEFCLPTYNECGQATFVKHFGHFWTDITETAALCEKLKSSDPNYLSILDLAGSSPNPKCAFLAMFGQ